MISFIKMGIYTVMRKKDSDRIEEFCRAEKKYPRILVNHYPVIEEQPLLRMRHRLYRQKNIEKLLKDKVIDLSICGVCGCERSSIKSADIEA